MTSIALNPGIILPATPHVHNGCCGHAHHHEKESPDANELAQKQVETSEPGFLTALWQKIKRWIWGDSEESQHTTDTKMNAPETSIQKQLHHAVPDKVANEQKTNSPANLSRHNHSGCSDGTCSLSSKNTTPSFSGGAHKHSGGCCGSSSSLSSPSFRATLSQSPVTREIYSLRLPTEQKANPLESASATVAGAKLADALKGRLVEKKAEKAFEAVLKSDPIFCNSTSSDDKRFAMAITKETLRKNSDVSTQDLTREIKQAMTNNLDIKSPSAAGEV